MTDSGIHSTALEIELLDDCVFSASSATAGGHESLDRVPGSALLGAAASTLYASLSRDEAFTVFHSGQVRFLDGMPLNGSRAAWPVPIAWHERKDRPALDGNGRLEGAHVMNYRVGRWGAGVQPKQLRRGYIGADGRLVQPRRHHRMKTAIDPQTGRAQESALFGYDVLERGQRFVVRVEADETVDPDLFGRVVDALVADGRILLGRSRSAEFGRARVSPRAGVDVPARAEPQETDSLTLWLLSDTALCDSFGRPTTSPDPVALGLDAGARVDHERSFIRTRRYSPWNAARGGFDSERQVCSAGSVISFRLPEPLSHAQRCELARGIGLHREAGLGQVAVNPSLLDGEHPTFTPTETASRREPAAEPNHPLLAFLSNQDDSWKTGVRGLVDDFVKDYFRVIEGARRDHGVHEHLPFGPSRSQWGRIQAISSQQKGQALMSALFEDNPIIHATAENWEITLAPRDRVSDKHARLADWTKQQIKVKAQEAKQSTSPGSTVCPFAWFLGLAAHTIAQKIEKG
jgi:hypothetical protein